MTLHNESWSINSDLHGNTYTEYKQKLKFDDGNYTKKKNVSYRLHDILRTDIKELRNGLERRREISGNSVDSLNTIDTNKQEHYSSSDLLKYRNDDEENTRNGHTLRESRWMASPGQPRKFLSLPTPPKVAMINGRFKELRNGIEQRRESSMNSADNSSKLRRHRSDDEESNTSDIGFTKFHKNKQMASPGQPRKFLSIPIPPKTALIAGRFAADSKSSRDTPLKMARRQSSAGFKMPPAA